MKKITKRRKTGNMKAGATGNMKAGAPSLVKLSLRRSKASSSSRKAPLFEDVGNRRKLEAGAPSLVKLSGGNRRKLEAGAPSLVKLSGGNRRKLGYIYTLEAAIAISIILVSITLVLSAQRAPLPLSSALVKQQAVEALEFLDQKGTLRPLVLAEDSNQIEKELRDLLPGGITIRADVCKDVDCVSNLPAASKSAISVDYYVSAIRETFVNRKVKVWISGNFQ